MLSAFPYQRNECVLHTDRSLLPRRQRAWASWNYYIPTGGDRPVALTYDVNRLQRLGAPAPICVTLNCTERIAPRARAGPPGLRPPGVHAGGGRGPAAARRDQRPPRALLLRGLLGIRFPRRRRQQCAGRLQTLWYRIERNWQGIGSRPLRGRTTSNRRHWAIITNHRLESWKAASTKDASATLAFGPVDHRFGYSLFMLYLDLDELPALIDKHWALSRAKVAPAAFRREDHFGDPAVPLADAVRSLVEEETGSRPEGPIRMLTQLRYWGLYFSPLNLFYCFDRRRQPRGVRGRRSQQYSLGRAALLRPVGRQPPLGPRSAVSAPQDVPRLPVHGHGRRVPLGPESSRRTVASFDREPTCGHAPVSSRHVAQATRADRLPFERHVVEIPDDGRQDRCGHLLRSPPFMVEKMSVLSASPQEFEAVRNKPSIGPRRDGTTLRAVGPAC